MEVEFLTLRDLSSPKKTKSNLEEVGCRSNQKENIFVDRKRPTPHNKDTMATMLTNGKNAASPEQLHITPIKHTERGAQSHPDPWTPTANLKMLISAASPDIRDREMKKVLFRPIENERKAEGEDVKMDDQFDAAEEDEVADEDEKKPSRKQKSLGLLCQKFLSLYPDYPTSEPISISLDKVATCLGVERRRIYDIINVLESLMIVGRRVKNQYIWHGRWRLSSTLAELQAIGRQQHYHLLMEQAGEGGARDGNVSTTLEDRGQGDSNYTAGRRKDKSLRIMSQKFVMLFLVSKTQTVSLDVAAKILIEENQDTSNNSKYKTKVRRLYDIANVLTSLGLIRKVHVQDERGRKPAFRWIGPADFHNSLAEDTEAVISIASPDAKTAPSSPHRELPGLLIQPVDYSRTRVSNSSQFRTATTDAAPPSSGYQTPSHSDSSPLVCSQGRSPLATHDRPEALYGGPPSQRVTPQQQAFLPSLDQASLFMLYGGPTAQGGLDPLSIEGQRSPGSRESVLGKRKCGEEDRNMATKEKREPSEMKSKEEGCLEGISVQGTTSQMNFLPGRTPGNGNVNRHGPPNNQGQPSHYLYVSNSADLGALNFLLSGSQTQGSLTGTVPTLALPYILVSSSTLPPYPLAASGGDANANLSFTLPAMMSSARFVMGADGSYVVAPEFSRFAAAPVISGPEQPGMYGSGSGTPQSPLEPRAPVTFLQTEPQTPQNLKETAAGSGSKCFFQTPGTMETASYPPLPRRRGSAQRRLDIGHAPSS